MVEGGSNGLIPEITGDGSATFYSEEFGEHFHCCHGAYTDAQHNYVDAANIPELARAEQLSILDVCYGLGYNTAAALDTIWRVNPECRVTIRALEINAAVVRDAIALNQQTNTPTQSWTPATQQILKTLATDYRYQSSTLDIQLIIGDARQTLQPLIAEGWQADAILFDPFSPKRCPQLWTVEFLALTTRCLATGGTLVTYSCAAAVRAAMKLAGLNIGSFPGAGRHWPCTIAAHQRPLPPLSLQEQEHLRTRAAIPYRDPTLRATAEAIMAQRQQEQQLCNLESTGAWRRRWPRGREA